MSTKRTVIYLLIVMLVAFVLTSLQNADALERAPEAPVSAVWAELP